MVGDNARHTFLAVQAFADVNANIAPHALNNGEKCMAFLSRQALWGDVPRPALVLLNVNMPQMSGDEVLSLTRADAGLCSRPVIMLSTSHFSNRLRHCASEKAQMHQLPHQTWQPRYADGVYTAALLRLVGLGAIARRMSTIPMKSLPSEPHRITSL